MIEKKTKTMTISEYMSDGQFFALMDVAALQSIGEQLDTLLITVYGHRTCGAIITSFIQDDGSVSLVRQKAIADSVYLLYKHKWDSLIAFTEKENDQPLTTSYSKTTTTYGHTVKDTKSGSDGYTDTNTIAGFDSSQFVDDKKLDHETKYGSVVDTEHGGENIMVSEKRDQQAERLVDYTLDFWNKHGLVDTVLVDAIKVLSLPLYVLDD